MALCEVSGVHKSFGKRKILDGVNFQFKTGEILGIFGRNGCGKSTMLQILFGTQTTQSGSIQIDGKSFRLKHKWWQNSEIINSQKIAYLPQFSFLPQSSKVWDVIPRFIEGQKQDLIFRAPRMADIAKRRVNELSLGERRYLEVLLIGNLNHPFLFLDEPFSMVEPLFKDLIHEFLLSQKTKKGILITDHYYQDVWRLADNKMVLTNGKLTAVTQLEELKLAGYLRSID